MGLLESGEMYLESILVLSKEKTEVHSVDIANYRGFSKPSVSRGIRLLKEGGYVEMEEGGALLLTSKGLEVARKIYERHQILSSLLMDLGVSEDQAIEDACRMEHVISDESMKAIKRWMKKKKADENFTNVLD